MTAWFPLVATMILPLVMAGCATTDLVRAAKDGDVAALHKQINAGADINESGVSAWVNGPPLSHAAYYCYPEAVNFLIKKGANVESVGGMMSFMMRPLHNAVRGNCKEAVRLLLDAGADINAEAKMESQSTPLSAAAYHGHVQLAEYLMSRGADIDGAMARLGDGREGKSAKALIEELRQKAVVEAARQAAQRQAEEKRQALESAGLEELLDMQPEKGLAIDALIQALIRAKNAQLPAFLVHSSVEERVSLLTAVELRIADAQALLARLNAQAEDAVRQGESAAPLREEAGKVQTYASILSAIRNLLQQS